MSFRVNHFVLKYLWRLLQVSGELLRPVGILLWARLRWDGPYQLWPVLVPSGSTSLGELLERSHELRPTTTTTTNYAQQQRRSCHIPPSNIALPSLLSASGLSSQKAQSLRISHKKGPCSCFACVWLHTGTNSTAAHRQPVCSWFQHQGTVLRGLKVSHLVRSEQLHGSKGGGTPPKKNTAAAWATFQPVQAPSVIYTVENGLISHRLTNFWSHFLWFLWQRRSTKGASVLLIRQAELLVKSHWYKWVVMATFSWNSGNSLDTMESVD